MMTIRYKVCSSISCETDRKAITLSTKICIFLLNAFFLQLLSAPIALAQENSNYLNAPIEQAKELGDSLLIG